MKDKDWLVMPCIILFILILVFLSITGFVRGTEKLQQEAIRKGHAEWVADSEGRAQFKWKEAKP